ncbi:hypothetical protein QLQ12_29535 [Actinoplanes sp. NEAU-A12]|uniref:Uncharacterized protein n=1 Tax=Actinoplanes sandaracinus TaxID=3045177 RepID=A0ABT6WT21_9ACTN|nr:hypothetical protein [Actinoplanes sandaracinus]MDI6102770.1 hypothetical protein [Actinoplanes sandaracinus]
MDRVEITDEGVVVTRASEAEFSVFGTQTRPASTHVSSLPWEEIFRVTFQVSEIRGHWRWVSLVIDVVWGEYFEVHDDADGFAETVREFCRLSGLPVPDPATTPPGIVTIWPGPDDDGVSPPPAPPSVFRRPGPGRRRKSGRRPSRPRWR